MEPAIPFVVDGPFWFNRPRWLAAQGICAGKPGYLDLGNATGEMAKITRLTLDQGGGLERRRLHLREISDDSDAPLETVGQDLRKARQRKGDDLGKISRILKIRKNHLDALEESNFDAIPGRAYTIGFVRAYANYLGLPSAEYIERLKAEIAGRSETKEPVQVSRPRDRKLPPGGVVLAVLFLLAAIYVAYYIIIAIGRMGTPPVTPVPARLTQAALAPVAAPPASPTPAAINPTPAPAVAIPPSNKTEQLPQGRIYGAQNASRITLLAHKPARVVVLGPEKKLYLDRLLQPGDSYKVPNVPGVTLSTSVANALEIIVDGSSKGYAGKDDGAAENMPLNPQELDRHG
jgi:cytoskeleton protein RodZ